MVDDHPVVRRGLVQLINEEKDLWVCGQTGEASEALELMRAARPDVVILDVELRGCSGLDLLLEIRAGYPGLPVLIFSMHDERVYAERVLRAGAMGYLMKDEAGGEIVRGIRKVLQGEVCVSPAVSKKIVQELVENRSGPSGIEALSNQELAVFTLIGKGLGPGEIAQRLHRSVKTIETYRGRIKRKLSLKSARELTQHAIQVGRFLGGSPPALSLQA